MGTMFDFQKNFKCQAINEIELAQKQHQKLQIVGLNATAIGFVMAQIEGKNVFVAKDLVSASKIAEMLRAFGKKIGFLPSAFENAMGLVDENLRDDFFSVYGDFLTGKTDFLIVQSDALFQRLPSKNKFLENTIFLKENVSLGFEKFVQELVKIGYLRCDFVANRGEFSVKGDTILLAPISCENVLRIEFFDDEVERISELGFLDKKLVAKHKSFDVYPREIAREDCNVLGNAEIVFLDEPTQLENQFATKELEDNFLTKEFVKKSAQNAVAFANIGICKTCFFQPDKFFHTHVENAKNYVHNFLDLVQDLKEFSLTSKKVFLFCKNKENKKNLAKMLEENFVFTTKIDGSETNIKLVEDFLPYSVILQDADAVLIGTNNLFPKQKVVEEKKKHKLFIPKINEFVVHEKHGLGKCLGVEKLKLSGCEKDYIIIEYAGGDKFYLPSEQADELSAYQTTETAPKLNKLGGADFAKVKEKVWKSVKEMAFDLLKLYAKRAEMKGKVYAKDDYLFEKFEETFMFEETPDQLRAISDIKADMESEKIMDRLVCGDVGFGKTEVALRAIFKAVVSGSQVAFLCPTTILAEQHYKTCLKRFSGFMVKTARFDRLMSKKEETEVLKGLADGSVNVVCGTHKLLSDKVKFKNLTLLVLDEEQRFGVEDKEKIKNLKANIDCLALSATPIPRTLHMSLTGIRDISIIDTPPLARQPVQTYVTEFDENLIQNAIKQELNRQGQVLIIYNRIDTIFQFASFVQKLVPNAKIGVAHGRLSQKSLEDTIMKLYAGEYQILVSTTLIENGIDLPTANTLIVVDADKLGLSQAYQIRGRIGRSDKVAYAYFLIKENKEISQNAFKRLTALMENTSLGSGMKIAMADLDIRGAGNVLGKEQSGNMMKVGYDLYYKLLKVAVGEVRGENVENVREVKIDVALDAFVPQTFETSEEERLNIITNLSTIETENQKIEAIEGLKNTYGNVPKEVENLATISWAKNMAQRLGVKHLVVNESGYKIYFYDKDDIVFEKKATILENLSAVLTLFIKQICQNS